MIKLVSKSLNLKQTISPKPDILIISPCGFDIIRIIKEIDTEREKYEEHIKLTTLQFAQNKF